MLNNLMRHSYLYTLYNCSVVFWWNWSVFNVLSKTCHITKIFRRSSAKFRYSFAPSAKTLASAEHYKGMFGAPLFQIPRWDTEVRFVTKFGKIGHCKVAKRSRGLPHKNKLALCGTRPSPHFVQNEPIAPKIPWTLSSLDMSTYTEFGPDRLRFAGLIPERLIFRPKKSLQYVTTHHKTSINS